MQQQPPPTQFHPFNQPPRRPKKPWYKILPWWAWVAIIFVLVIIGATQNKNTTAVTTAPAEVKQQAAIPVVAAVAPTQTPFIIVVTATPAPAKTVAPTPVPATTTVAPTATNVPTPKPIAVFGQGIGTSLNSKGEPQSPTSRYREDAEAYFFLNFQDATPNETVGIFVTALDGKTKVFDSQKAFGQSVGFVSFLVAGIKPGAYQAHFEARGQRVGSLFNFEVLPKPTPVPPTATPVPTPEPPILAIKGSGTRSTQSFFAPDSWNLSWAYDCSNFGVEGNFIVYIYNNDGTEAFDVGYVNQLGMRDSGLEYYHAGGGFYLKVISECNWSLKVTR